MGGTVHVLGTAKSQFCSEPGRLVSNCVIGYGLPPASKGPRNLNEVGWVLAPSAQSAMYELPSKSRSPFWKNAARQPLTGHDHVWFTPFTLTVREPAAKQG